MTDQVELVAASFLMLCTKCGRKNVVSEVAQCVECTECRTMIRCTEKAHRFHKKGSFFKPGVLTVGTYAYKCPDCDAHNRVPTISEVVKCPSCASELDVSRATFGQAQERLL